ncbi:MAG TPA: class I SAM-dependent methyltransferase [Sulfurimonas sp.]|uniref:class I SAM-dependent methyltransferase n=1 Tax=Sulfurimonas sp. TaxID=2022749 RepID=UPI002CFABE4B|nr:class I SAM-dependent methyltransferase [Sulfurimonas sp.]HUH43248.1 class I SAM-dependent methyltransferase [Sulfurimonas sp.]
MSIEELRVLLRENSKDVSEEFKRLFHGRGGIYDGFKYLTIDSIDKVLSVALFTKDEAEEELLLMIKEFMNASRYKTLVVQRRYEQGSVSEVLVGELDENLYALENGMKFKLNLLSNQNSYYFADMKNGRAFVRENAKDKRVLNLFSYTCAFSVAAKLSGAQSVSNIDMSKASLSIGEANHHLNKIEPRGVSYLPHNILKSFSKIKQNSPYDLIIIDPPTFQRGSFEASKDYEKIVKKLSQIASDDCQVLACLNSTELDCEFIINLFKEFAPEFSFVRRLDNVKEFANFDEQKSLKNLLFYYTH